MVNVMRLSFIVLMAIAVGVLIMSTSGQGIFALTCVSLGSLAGAAIKNDRVQAASAASWIAAGLALILAQPLWVAAAGPTGWLRGGFLISIIFGGLMMITVSILAWPAGWLFADLRAFVDRRTAKHASL